MTEKELFDKKVVPIMNKVRDELQHKQAEEMSKHMNSMAYIFAGAAGPDGGMVAQAASLDSLRYTGEWNSKTVEDYVEMVKNELKGRKISITPQVEQMMIDKMIRDKMPKSSIDYIMRKAASNTIFGLPNEIHKSPLEREIEAKGEALYKPSAWEKNVGWGLGAAADFVTMGGASVGGALKFVGLDLAVNHVLDNTADTGQKPTQTAAQKQGTGRDERYKDVPMVVMPGQEEAYLADLERLRQQKEQAKKSTATVAPTEPKQEDIPEGQTNDNLQDNEPKPDAEQPEQANTSGWQGVLTSFGLNGLSDLGHNAGYILAMLPDILVGMFTGRTQSLGMKDNLMPIASIVAGLFVKNPLLKMTLIGMGGANLLNKAGHEELARREGVSYAPRVAYRQYEEQPLDPRIDAPEIHGNCLIASIDHIPVTISLLDKVADAYKQGALPLSTLANAVLMRTDQMQQVASAQQRFEEESQAQTRGLSQR